MRSLAVDILARAGRQVRVTAEPMPAELVVAEPKVKPSLKKYGNRWYNPMYGVQYLNKTGQYRARPRHHRRPFELGTFNTAERASVAVRLFKHWQKLGYGDIPKPPCGKY